jgi:phage/plasmid-like protein (TIGR03299 family)
MAYAGSVPWHGLGKAVSNDLSPKQLQVASDTDWMVEKIGATVLIQGEQKDINRAALVRSSDNKILDTVTREWCPLQNEEAFQFFHDFVMAGDMEMHTAGSLKGGQIVWCLAKIKDGFVIAGKDHVESHLLFTNPHQFGKAIDIRFTPIRVVCWNTLSLALGTGSSFDQQQIVKMSHRKAFEPDKAKELLGIAHNKLVTYREAAEFMAGVRFTDEKLNQFFREIFPKKTSKKEELAVSRNHAIALDVIRSQPGADMAEGSWWQAFNAVTYMTDHLMGRAVDSRLHSAWFGSNRDLKTKALKLATEFANA